jgi:4,5-dihydroxyphthalate decarboxylase
MSAELELSAAMLPNARTRAILDGSVAPQGIRLLVSPIAAPELFWRQLKFSDFDVSEMSVASLTIATSKAPTSVPGTGEWVALPIFSMRRVFHSQILVRAAAGIEKPADLRGKRIGVPEYQQTGAVWCRGPLLDEFGVDARDCLWFMERTPEISHGGSTGFTPPPGIRFEYIPPSTNIGEMLLNGTLDATLLYIEPSIVDRSTADLNTPAIRPLFPSPLAEAHRYYAKTGVYPINHTVVVRRSILEREPWVAQSLFDAFGEAKARAAKRRLSLLEPLLATGVAGNGTADAVAADVMAYGIRANRPVLELLMRYLHEQGLTERRMRLDEVFHSATLDW